jgi:hypothetical protein
MKHSSNKSSKSVTGKPLLRALLPVLIASALAATSVQAQDTAAAQAQDPASECEDMQGTPPGLYATTDEGRTFLIKGDKTVELAPGEAAYANENQLNCIKAVPDFLDWPCATDAAQARKFATYTVDKLEPGSTIKQIVQRYFEIPEVIEPVPNWQEGEFTVKLDFKDIVPYSSPEYWYKTDPKVDIMEEKRPKTLLISLYVGVNKVVIDNYTVDALNKFYGGKEIPVVFVFNDSNAVPVSYFGSNVSLEEIRKAFNERQIKLADVPLWQLGDHHFFASSEEYEKLFDLPATEDIDPLRQEALAANLETYAFTRKPVFVTIMEGGKMYIDDPDRVRIALNMGITRLPTVINFIEADSELGRCGPGTPVGSSGVSGATTPIGGAVPPSTVPPPPIDPEVPSDS